VIKSNPAQNQQASADLKTVSIQFSEEIQQSFLTLQVLDENDHRVDTDQAHIDKKNPAVLVNNVKKKLSVGYYRIVWKVISADGHSVHGTIGFKVGQPTNDPSTTQTGNETGSDFPGTDHLVIRWLLYIGLSVYFGLIVFLKFLYPARNPLIYQRKSISIALLSSAGILLLGVLLTLPLQVTTNADVNWLHALNGKALRATLFATSFGSIWFLLLGTLLASIALQYWIIHPNEIREDGALPYMGTDYPAPFVFSVQSLPGTCRRCSGSKNAASGCACGLSAFVCRLDLAGFIIQPVDFLTKSR
jgi:copper transport protein